MQLLDAELVLDVLFRTLRFIEGKSIQTPRHRDQKNQGRDQISFLSVHALPGGNRMLTLPNFMQYSNRPQYLQWKQAACFYVSLG